jgi:hypothetical protein
MIAKTGDRRAKSFVRDFLATTCGVTLRDVERRPDAKTADFEMVDGSEHVLFAELKTLVSYHASSATGWTEDEDGIWRRIYNAPARIGENIHDAYRQLSEYPHPWAVIIHNTDFRVHPGAFYDAFAGDRELQFGDRGVIITNARKVALGKMMEVRHVVDLFIWINQENRQPRLVVWSGTPIGKEIGQRYFSAAAGEYKF